VLVPTADGAYDEHVMATAVKLAARKRRGIHVVSFVTVPYALPITAPMEDGEAAAESVIEQARIQGGGRVSGHTERIRPGQAGRRIVEEAVDMRAAAIVMALPRRIDGASLFGKTLETVLAERPCRVIIESTPPPAPTFRRRRALERERVAA
jgi:APA family basic amino acid/polyamine antiporter